MGITQPKQNCCFCADGRKGSRRVPFQREEGELPRKHQGNVCGQPIGWVYHNMLATKCNLL